MNIMTDQSNLGVGIAEFWAKGGVPQNPYYMNFSFEMILHALIKLPFPYTVECGNIKTLALFCHSKCLCDHILFTGEDISPALYAAESRLVL